ncbi:MAG: hypothetical protein EBY92_04235, partial [Actinobacteria bacterium]|nr:hypothetical protein [Actinomycetota bacterium]
MARPAVTTPPAIYVSSSRYDLRHLMHALPAQHDVSIVCNESGKRLSEDQLIATRPPNCVGIIAGLEPLSARVLDHYGDVKVIARLG